MGDIKRVKRELVAKGHILDYYHDTVEISNGNVVVWDFIGHKGAAAVVPVLEDGRILMVKQYRNALDRYTIEIPAGGVDTVDEPHYDAAMRELKEETGYTTDELEFLIAVNTTVAFCNEKISIFLLKISFSRSNISLATRCRSAAVTVLTVSRYLLTDSNDSPDRHAFINTSDFANRSSYSRHSSPRI